MSNRLPDSLLTEDDRAVTPLIGFILLFGILIIAFAGYQAEVVPEQNQEVEFEHLQNVENDLTMVRSSVLTAGLADVTQFQTVGLGTTYPTRLFALNPPDPIGKLQTSDPYNITVTNETGATTNVSTRFLEYRPGYRELPSNSIWYENSVLYREFDEDIAVLEKQNLLTDEETLRVTALQNELREQGTGRVTLELYPTQNFTSNKIPTGNLTVKLPTRLTGGEYWNQAFDSQNLEFNVTPNAYEEGVHELELDINTSKNSKEFKLNTVGIQEEPKDRDSAKQGVGQGDSDDEDTDETDDSLPNNAVAFDDVDGDGDYQDSETTYSESELESFTGKNVDLVIERNINSGKKFDIDTNSLLVKPGTNISTVGNSNIDFDIETNITISGATIDSGKDIAITSGKKTGSDIDARDTVFQFSGKAEAFAKGGTFFVNKNGGDRADGGTYIEDQNGNSAELKLKKGNKQGSAEFGKVV